MSLAIEKCHFEVKGDRLGDVDFNELIFNNFRWYSRMKKNLII